MTRRAWIFAIFGAVVVGALVYGGLLIAHGFSAAEEPSSLEKLVARTTRNLAIPNRARTEKNPLEPTDENLKDAQERFIARCAICHGNDGGGQSEIGRNLY